MRLAGTMTGVALLGATLWAQGVPPELVTHVEPTAATLGDRIRVVITVDHATDARVAWPDALSVEPFELLAMQPLEPTTQGMRSRSSMELTLTAFELGALTLPALEIDVVGADGQTWALSSEPTTITISSVGRDAGGDIRDIKGPLSIPFRVVTLLPWLAGLVASALVLFWLRRFYGRRGATEAPMPVEAPRPAHEIAHEALNRLEASGLLQRGDVKAYHIRASDIMRVYVEDRFGVDAMEMTTREVLGGLRQVGVTSDVVGDFRQLLDRCDLVKFAKHRPAVEACRDVVPLARRLVDATRLVHPGPDEAEREAHVA